VPPPARMANASRDNAVNGRRFGLTITQKSIPFSVWIGQTPGRGEGTAAFDAWPGPQRVRLDAVE